MSTYIADTSVQNQTTIENALSATQDALGDPEKTPRTGYELVHLTEAAISTALTPQSKRVYVPDAEGPTTPSVKEEQIRGPANWVESEIRALALRGKNLVIGLMNLVNETNRIQGGIQTQLQSVGSKVESAQALISSSSLGWMRFSDNFGTSDNVDSSATTQIFIDPNSGGGVTLAPLSEQDMSGSVANLTISANRSTGIPGDNMELAALQDVPSSNSPAAGSYNSLSQTQQVVGSSGGSGQEPTVSYAGYPDQHNNLSNILVDQNEYFQWEQVYVPPLQQCSQLGTAYVYDEYSGSTIDVRTVTDNYGWQATIQEPDGSQTTNTPLVVFRQYPPGAQTGVTPLPTDVLKLSLQLDMGTPTALNNIEIDVIQVEGLWPSIQGVEVSSDNTTWYALQCQGGATSWTGDAPASAASLATSLGSNQATGNYVLGSSIWEVPSSASFESSTAGIPQFQYINIILTQAQAYQCPKGIGHPYYVEVVNDSSKSSGPLGGLFGGNHQSTTVTNTRYPSPQPIIGVAVGSSTTQTSNPGAAIGSALGTLGGAAITATTPGLKSVGNILTGTLSNIGSAVGSFLFGNSSDTKTVLQAGEYNDVFQAFRQCIAVKRVKPMQRQFPVGTAGQLVTEAISFGSPFSAVRLFVDDIEPNGTSVQYSISVDEGQTWQPINAMNLGTVSASYISSQAVVSLANPATSIKIQATFNTTQSQSTPRLLGYLLEALPAT